MGDKNSLEQQVIDFAMLQLPGQPQMMHMGTAYLVDDLYREIERLREAGEKIIEGFDANIFVRNIENDTSPSWALRILPYIQALGVFKGEEQMAGHKKKKGKKK